MFETDALTLSKSFNGFVWSSLKQVSKNGTGVGPGGKFWVAEF